MAQSAKRFAELLQEGITTIADRTSKPKGVIRDQLGYAIGRKGGSAIEYWAYGDGRIPKQQSEVAALARVLVEVGNLDQHWIISFLESAGYPDRDSLISMLFPDASSSLSHNLPLPPTPFVGREKELVELADLLANPNCRHITLVGPGGSGKTRLAIEAARHLYSALHENWSSPQELSQNEDPSFHHNRSIRAQISSAAGKTHASRRFQDIYGDGLYFVPLAAVEHSDTIPAATATAMGIPLEGSGAVITQLLDRICELKLLLILDNFEQFLPDTTFVNTMMDAAPSVTMVITSREQLRLYGEHCYEVAGLPTGDAMTNYADPNSAAIRLFIQRAKQRNANFQPKDNELTDIAQICSMVDGIPLGIELAASWVGVLSCQQIIGELDASLIDFSTTYRDIDKRHSSLGAVVQHSWKRLSKQEQDILQRLSVFRGGFDLEAGRAVTGASLPQLAALVHKSLLQSQTSERYETHEFIRQFAGEQLRKSGLEFDARERHLHYFITLAGKGDKRLLTAEQLPWLQQFEKEHDNIRAALRWSIHLTKMPDSGIPLIANLGWFWYFAGHWREAFTWIEKFLPPNGQFATTSEYAKALYNAGGIAVSIDRYEQALDYFNASIEISRQLNDRETLGFALSLVNLLYVYTGDYDAGKSAALESIALFDAIDYQPGYYWALGTLGEALLYSGEFAAAQVEFEKCVQYYNHLGVNSLQPYALLHLGKAEYYLKHYDLAHAYLTDAIKLARELQAQRFTALALHGLTQVCLHNNEWRQASQHLREALLIFHRLGDHVGLAECFDTTAVLFRFVGQHADSARVLGASERFRQEIGIPVFAGNRSVHQTEINHLQDLLGQRRFESAWVEWQSIPYQSVVDLCVEYMLHKT